MGPALLRPRGLARNDQGRPTFAWHLNSVELIGSGLLSLTFLSFRSSIGLRRANNSWPSAAEHLSFPWFPFLSGISTCQ